MTVEESGDDHGRRAHPRPAGLRTRADARGAAGRPGAPGGPGDAGVLDYAFGSPATAGLYRLRGEGWSWFCKVLQHVRHWPGLAMMPPPRTPPSSPSSSPGAPSSSCGTSPWSRGCRPGCGHRSCTASSTWATTGPRSGWRTSTSRRRRPTSPGTRARRTCWAAGTPAAPIPTSSPPTATRRASHCGCTPAARSSTAACCPSPTTASGHIPGSPTTAASAPTCAGSHPHPGDARPPGHLRPDHPPRRRQPAEPACPAGGPGDLRGDRPVLPDPARPGVRPGPAAGRARPRRRGAGRGAR